MNAFAERFVESVKSECLDGMVLLSERQIQAAVREFVHHYHEERPHQGLGSELVAPKTTTIGAGQVKCRERIGDLMKFYYRGRIAASVEFSHRTGSRLSKQSS